MHTKIVETNILSTSLLIFLFQSRFTTQKECFNKQKKDKSEKKLLANAIIGKINFLTFSLSQSFSVF